MKMVITKSIDLKECPEIMRLAKEGEELKDLLKLPPEQILIRWINFHLAKKGQTKEVTNLGKDLADSVALTYVLNSLDESKCDMSPLDEEDLVKRADLMIKNSEKIGVPALVRPSDITSGNVKLNTVFVASIFNTKHGLEELTTEEKGEFEAATLVDDDIEGTKDERAFRLWINSLNIDDVYVMDLFNEAKDGMLLLKVIDKIKPGTVDWKKVEKNPNNKFKMGINCKEVIESAKRLNLQLPGIGGADILEGNKKLILAVVWQLVRLHYLQLIGSKKEDDLVKWANDLVGEVQIKSFKDKALSNGQFLIKLCAAIEPRAVNWDIVQPGETEEEMDNNAKYVISIARKLGCVIFCVYEDIPKVNYKMMLVLICSLFEAQQEMK